MSHAEPKDSPSNPTMENIELFVVQTCKESHKIGFSSQRYQKRRQRSCHQFGPNSEWRRAVSTVLMIVWSSCEGQDEEEDNTEQQNCEHAQRRGTRSVTNGSIEASVREMGTKGLRLVNKGMELAASGGLCIVQRGASTSQCLRLQRSTMRPTGCIHTADSRKL